MITFIETKLFTRLVEEYLSDDSLSAVTSRYCIGLRSRTSHPWFWRSSQTPVGNSWTWKTWRN